MTTQNQLHQQAKPELSIVIPIYNEEENIAPLFNELNKVLPALGKTYEILAIDDGSKDNSFYELKKQLATTPQLKIIRFRRNFGQTAAISAGFDHAEGKITITLDADLQNDPKDIPLLLAKLEEGYDIVSGWRKNRKEPFFSRRLPSIVANKLISILTGVHLHDYGCTLKAYRSEVVKNLNLYGEMHRFIPALASEYGASITEVVVHHQPRQFGKSKYGISRTFKVLLDLLTLKFLLGYFTKPIRLFGGVGLLTFLIGFIISAYLSYERLVLKLSIANRPLLLLAVLLMFLGMQFISIGLLAEIIIRTYHKIQKEPIYKIKEIVVNENFNSKL